MNSITQVSFSGGRSSAMMAKIMKDSGRDGLLFMFANTGKEMPETLDFVNECDRRWNLGLVWIEYDFTGFKVVDYKTASREGEPFEALIEKRKYLPNRVTRFCTSELKIRPMAKYIRSKGIEYWNAAVGIRYDEPNRYRRMKANTKDRWTYEFPLYDFRVTEKQVFDFWSEQEFDLQIPSQFGNCDFCFMKGLAKKVAQARQMPERLDWWIEMERRTGARFHKDFTIKDILKLSQTPTLFDLNEPELGCFCGD
jgi:hypothetical protein